MYTFRLEIYVGQLLISGNYDMQIYRRLSDALNGDLQRYITLTGAIVAPLHRPQQAERVSHILVDRSDMLFVATLKEPDPPPDYVHNQYTARREIEQLMFFTKEFSLRANLYKRPNLSVEETFNQTTDDFFPLSQAYIFPMSGGKPIVRDFVCLGRRHIQAAYLSKHHESI